MAKDKNSFILYADLLQTVSKLTDAKAGKLFKMILEYVNDKNPQTDDLLIQVAFEPVRQQLKRDLRDWEEERQNRSEAGKRGMAKRWGSKKSITDDNSVIIPITKITDTVTVTDNVTVNDTVILSIERCGEIALADPRWIKANKVQDGEVSAFNNYLEQQGKYTMNPLDYKTYFAKLKGKYPDLIKKKFSIEELRQMALEQDKILQNG